MKVQAINNYSQHQAINQKTNNNPNFNGIVKSETITDLMTKTPVMIQDKFKAKEFSPAKTARLMDKFMKDFESINDRVHNLNFFTTLETQGNKVKEVVLKNKYSEYVEPLNFKFAEKCDDFKNKVFRAVGYKIANGSIEENVDILTDLANCLEKVDFHSVEAKMVLHSDNPSCIRDAIRETYKNQLK
jgi:hypothetical protein